MFDISHGLIWNFSDHDSGLESKFRPLNDIQQDPCFLQKAAEGVWAIRSYLLTSKAVVWTQPVWITPSRQEARAAQEGSMFNLFLLSPHLLCWPLQEHPCLQEHLHRTELSKNFKCIFLHISNYLWNVIHLICTSHLQGVKIAHSPEAFMYSGDGMPASVSQRRDLTGHWNGWLVCGIDSLICYMLIINQHLRHRQYMRSDNQPCSLLPTGLPSLLQNSQSMSRQMNWTSFKTRRRFSFIN